MPTRLPMALAATGRQWFHRAMGRGLDSFDSFEWASLLAGHDILILDDDRRRAMKTAAAFEEAGARATLAHDASGFRDRMLRGRFRLIVAAITDKATAHAPFPTIDELGRAPAALLIMCQKPHDAGFRAGAQAGLSPERLATTRFVDITIDARDIVMAVTGTQDE